MSSRPKENPWYQIAIFSDDNKEFKEILHI
jgi:hypothetical protein